MIKVQDEFDEIVTKLSPKLIDRSKCTPTTSFHQQIRTNTPRGASAHQEKQFNLGNGQRFSDPIHAAEYLLEREYGQTHLFDKEPNETVFIPPEFISKECFTNTGTAILNYDIVQSFEESLNNLTKNNPDFWFTAELREFLDDQYKKNRTNESEDLLEISKSDYDKWILKIKKIFIDADSAHSCQQGEQPLKKWIKKEMEMHPVDDSVLKWFFSLELSNVGEKQEHWFFHELLQLKETVLKDMVVLTSCEFYTDKVLKKHQEIDFLLFDSSRKLIICIEAKRSFTKQATDKAIQQMEKYHEIFETRLADQLGNGWTFVPVLCVENINPEFQADSIMTSQSDLPNFLNDLLQRYPQSTSEDSKESKDALKKVLQILIFTIHMSKNALPTPITTSNRTDFIQDAIKAVSTRDNIIFYSTNQLPVFAVDDGRYDKLMIKGDYGTGKSFLLLEKAEILSKQGYKVLYFVGHLDETLRKHETIKSLFQLFLEGWKGRKKEERKNIIFVNLWDLLHYVELKGGIEEFSADDESDDELKRAERRYKNTCIPLKWLLRYAREYNFTSFLWDESNDDIAEEIINNGSCWDFSHIWIASYKAYNPYDDKHDKALDTPFEFLTLKCPMRNTKEVIKKSYEIREKYPPRSNIFPYTNFDTLSTMNFPEGIPCNEYDNPDHAKVIKEALKAARKGVLVILPDHTEPALYLKGIIRRMIPDENPNGKHKMRHYMDVSTTTFGDYEDITKNIPSIEPERCMEYLQEKGNILITNMNVCERFEWDTVVCIDDSEYSYSDNNVMRCIVNLFVVNRM